MEENKTKEEVRILSEKLEEGLNTLLNSEKFKEYLQMVARIPAYSWRNNILIMLQKPEATMVQGINAWNRLGRRIKKGEHGLRILAPVCYSKIETKALLDEEGIPIIDDDGKVKTQKVKMEIQSYKPISVFDISQTEGKDLPMLEVKELKGNDEFLKILKDAIISSSNVKTEFADFHNSAKGFFDIDNDRIVIKNGLSDEQTIKTLFHETAHSLLHSEEDASMKSREVKELEAESVAFICCERFGIDSSDYSFPYIASWVQEETMDELKGALSRIQNCAEKIINKVEAVCREQGLIEVNQKALKRRKR